MELSIQVHAGSDQTPCVVSQEMTSQPVKSYTVDIRIWLPTEGLYSNSCS